MKISELTISTVKDYIRVDNEDENILIETFLKSAKNYVKNYTGLSDIQMDEKEDLTTAVLILCADMYDNRTATEVNTKTKVSFVLDSILSMYCVNLL